MGLGLAQMRRAASFVDDYFLKAGQLPSLPPIRGQWFFVDPYQGSDTGRTGKSISQAFASFKKAYDSCVSGRGDGIAVLSGGITAANTSSYLSASLDWTKWGITVFGVCAPTRMAQRSRIANLSTVNTLVYMIDVQGSNNSFLNISISNFGTDKAAVGGVKVTGNRNYFGNVHFIGGGGRAGQVGDYDLSLTGSENTFENCVLGSDTWDRGDAANCNLLLPGGGAIVMRNKFIGCEFTSKHAAGTTAGAVRLARSDAIQGDLLFDNCYFNVYRDGAIAAEVAVAIGTAPDNGFLVFRNCSRKGFTDWKDVDATFAARVVSLSVTTHEAGGAASLANPS